MHLTTGEILIISASAIFVPSFLVFYLVRSAVKSVIHTQSRSVRKELANHNRLLVRLLKAQGVSEQEINSCFLDQGTVETTFVRKGRRQSRPTGIGQENASTF